MRKVPRLQFLEHFKVSDKDSLATRNVTLLQHFSQE